MSEPSPSPAMDTKNGVCDHAPFHCEQDVKRPRLAHLRSEWSSSSQSSHVEDGHPRSSLSINIPIISRLPYIDRMSHEVQIAALAVGVLCIISSIVFALLDGAYRLSMHMTLAWGFMIAWTLATNNVDAVYQYAQYGVMVMILTQIAWCQSCQSLPWTLLPTLCGQCLIILGQRVNQARMEQNNTMLQYWNLQQAQVQNMVNADLEHFTDQRRAFTNILSREIQDAALMVITTLVQFSPVPILTSTYELLSACSIAVPITSISAINTTIKQICHISSNLTQLESMVLDPSLESGIMKSDMCTSFDVSETLQMVGDALAGIACNLDVDLILFHSNNGLHDINALGDEAAMTFALFSLLRSVLEVCPPGASIELGLDVISKEDDESLQINFDIVRTISADLLPEDNITSLPNAMFTHQLLKIIRGRLSTDENDDGRVRYHIEIQMDKSTAKLRTSDPNEKPVDGQERQMPGAKISHEPTLEELVAFIARLKGIKMVLHAREHSMFAVHLTRCLASWNADISHVPVVFDTIPTEGGSELLSVASTEGSEVDAGSSTGAQTTPVDATIKAAGTSSGASKRPSAHAHAHQIPSPALEEEHIHAIPPAFVLIDDDIPTLERKLREFSMQPPAPMQVLQDHQQIRRHRRSRSNGPSPNFFHQGSVAILFFASLDNLKNVRDAIYWFSVSAPKSPFSVPRVVVVPKPAGPRRFLTALHTAWNNVVVDPRFMPIATSPLNRPPQSAAELLSQQDTEARSTPGSGTRAVSSPLAGKEGAGYFADAPLSPQGNPVPITSPTSSDVAQRRLRSLSQSGSPKTPPSTWSASTVNTPGVASPPATMNCPNVVASTTTIMATAALATTSMSSATVVAPAVAVAVTSTPIAATPATPPDASSPMSNAETKESVTETQTEDNASQTAKVPRAKTATRKRKDKAKATSPPIKVLIVEDNRVNQIILSTWMKQHKINFDIASDGKEAVEKWQGGGFHLVLMDIQLPVMSGLEATERIRAIEHEQKIGVLPKRSSSTQTLHVGKGGGQDSPVDPNDILETTNQTMTSQRSTLPSMFRSPVIIVALTASSLESDREAALAAGCNDFLTKPVSLPWLEKKIMEWGCMQALIDVEGWRVWRRTITTNEPVPSSTATDAASHDHMGMKQEGTGKVEEEIAQETSLCEQEDVAPSSERQGILLSGWSSGMAQKRRSSTVPGRAQHAYLRSTESDPMLDSRHSELHGQAKPA